MSARNPEPTTYPRPTTWPDDSDIWHLVPNGFGGFNVLLWPTLSPQDYSWDSFNVDRISVCDLSVHDDENLLVLRLREVSYLCDFILSIHKPDGSVIRSIKLSYNAKQSLANI